MNKFKDEKFFTDFDGALTELESAKLIFEIKPHRDPPTTVRFHIPTFGVSREDKTTTKTRPVQDASHKFRQPDGTLKSLNDEILECPVNVKDVAETLMKFRKHDVSVIGDVSKMFLMVKAKEEDQPLLSFLWRDRATGRVKHMQYDCHLFGKKDSPFLAIETLNHQARRYAEEYPNAARAIINNLLVDDLMTSVTTVEEAKGLYEEITQLLTKHCGMKMRKFSSNSTEFKDWIPDDMRAPNIFSNDEVPEAVKTLGLLYFPHQDAHSFDYEIEIPKLWTVAATLSVLSKVYDPTGVLAPFLVVGRTIFRELWEAMPKGRKKSIWKQEIPPEFVVMVESWLQHVAELKALVFPRCWKANAYEDRRLADYNPYFNANRPLCVHYLTGFDCDCAETSEEESPEVDNFRLMKLRPPSIECQKLELGEIEPFGEVPDDDEHLHNPFRYPWSMGVPYGHSFEDHYTTNTKEEISFKTVTLDLDALPEPQLGQDYCTYVDWATAKVEWVSETPEMDRFKALSSTIHVFADASKKIYCATAYMQVHYWGIPTTIRHMFSKAKLAPKNITKIPRLELMASTLAVEVLMKLKKGMGSNNHQCNYVGRLGSFPGMDSITQAKRPLCPTSNEHHFKDH